MSNFINYLSEGQLEFAEQFVKNTRLLSFLNAEPMIDSSDTYDVAISYTGIDKKYSNKATGVFKTIKETRNVVVSKKDAILEYDADKMHGISQDKLQRIVIGDTQRLFRGLEQELVAEIYGWQKHPETGAWSHVGTGNTFLRLAHTEIDATGTDAPTKTSAYMIDRNSVSLLVPDNFLAIENWEEVFSKAPTRVPKGNGYVDKYLIKGSMSFGIKCTNQNGLIRIKNIDKTKLFDGDIYKKAVAIIKDYALSDDIFVVGKQSTISGLSGIYGSNLQLGEGGALKTLAKSVDDIPLVVDGLLMEGETL